MKRLLFVILFVTFFGDGLLAGGLEGRVGLGFNFNTQKLYGDTRTGTFTFGASPVIVRFNFKEYAFLEGDIGYSRLTAKVNGSDLNTDIFSMGAKIGYRFFSQSRVNPLIYLGIGGLNFSTANSRRFWDGYGVLGGGFEFLVTNSAGINITGDFRYTSGDDFDGSRLASGKDAFFNAAFGITYYFGGGRNYDNGYDYDSYYSDAMTEDRLPVEELAEDHSLGNGHAQPAYSKNLSESNGNANNMANDFQNDMLRAQKEDLLDSIEMKNDQLKLLKAKAAVMRQVAEMLESNVDVSREATNGHGADGLSGVYNNGLFLYATGEYGDAIEVFSKLLTEYPEHFAVGTWWYWLGESYFGLQNYLAAAAAFENSLSNGVPPSKNQTVQLMLALSRWKTGDVNRAYGDLRNLLRQEPHPEYENLIHGYLAELELKHSFQE